MNPRQTASLSWAMPAAPRSRSVRAELYHTTSGPGTPVNPHTVRVSQASQPPSERSPHTAIRHG